MKPVVILMMLAALLFSAGCSSLEPEKPLSPSLDLADTFSMAEPVKTDQLESQNDSNTLWHHFLKNHELNRLMSEALEQNFDIKVLEARLDQARAVISKAEASFFPDLDFSFGGQKQGTQVKRSRSSGSSYDGSHSWNASLGSSYTLDVWGQDRADRMASVSDREASEYDLNASRINLSATIARAWLDIIAVRNQLGILEHQIKTNYTLLELLKLRFLNGQASALDVSQQQGAIAQAGALVPILEQQEKQLLNSLALLSGSASADSVKIETQDLPDPVPVPGIGIPSDLLDSRPDIKAAEARLISSEWEIKAAKADLLPSFNLSAQALFSSGELDLLFHNWVATLVGNIAGPLFDGGFRRAEVDRVRAVAMEQVSLYARTVAEAVVEVEDSLVSIEKQDEYVRLLEEELALARITLKDARIQYQNGQSSFLNYLIAWTSIQRLERQLVGERATAIKDRITLCESLGRLPDVYKSNEQVSAE